MKTQGLKFLIFALLLSMSFIACNKSTDLQDQQFSDLQDQQYSDVPTDDALFPTEMEHEQRLVAVVQKDGHELQFLSYGDPEENNLLMIEGLYGEAAENGPEALYLSSENTNQDVEISAFDIFMKMTDSTTEVPEEIALTAKNDQFELSGRSIMNSHNTLEILDKAADEQLEARSCTNADLKWSRFRRNACWGDAFNSNAADIRFCDSGTWISHIRNSYFSGWRTTKRVRSAINNVCTEVKVNFYNWSNGKWVLNASPTLGTNRFYYLLYASHSSGQKKYWSVRSNRLRNTGYFRSSTRFYD